LKHTQDKTEFLLSRNDGIFIFFFGCLSGAIKEEFEKIKDKRSQNFGGPQTGRQKEIEINIFLLGFFIFQKKN
jgi:hypothetical protein